MRLITGGNGFIARNLRADSRISSAQCDLTKLDEVRNLLHSLELKEIIHCAAKHGSFLRMQMDHTHFLSENLRIDSNLIQAAALRGVKKLIAVSSVSTLGTNNTEMLSESDLSRINFSEANFGYNASKRASIDLVKAVNLDFGFNYKAVLLGNIYGPHDHFEKEGTVVASIISQMLVAKSRNEDLELFGSGRDARTFTFVGDLNPVFDFLLEQKSIAPVIVSSNQTATISEVAEIIKRAMGFKGKIIFLNSTSGSHTIKVTSNAQLQKNGFSQEWTTLQNGIQETVDWALLNV